MINPIDFQKSINKELQVVKNRVRNLIGDANWGDEGAYKEAVLQNIIGQYLPDNLSIGKGYILKKDEIDNEFIVSKQIDIIIYDNTFPVIFSEGRFVIVVEECVRGIIEVKSRIYTGRENQNSLIKIIEKFNELNQFLRISNTTEGRIFKGIFGFDFNGNLDSEIINEALRLSNGMVNHISLNSSIFVRHWINGDRLLPPVDCVSDFYNVYNIADLSHSYFLSNLIHMTCDHNLVDRYWFSFPIEGTKERNRIRTICLNQ